MSNLTTLRMESRLVSISADDAMYCRACHFVSNSKGGRCGLCASEFLISVSELAGRPPNDLDPGPTPSGAIAHAWQLADARAA